jgi:hypothetical protein
LEGDEFVQDLEDFPRYSEISILDGKFKVLNCSTQPTTSDPYGEVNGGSLTLQCPVPEAVTLINRRLYLQNWRVRLCKVYLDFLPSRQHQLFMIPIWTTFSKDWGLLVEYVGVPGIYRRVGLYNEEPKPWKPHEAETVTFTTITIT